MAKEQSLAARSPQSVVVVDDHPVFRRGMVELLRDANLTVAAEASDAAQALSAIEQAQPDLVLMDIGLPGKDGLDLLKDIVALRPGLPVLAISVHDETLYAERVLRAGGKGYIMKQESPDRINDAIHKVLSGKIYVSERVSALILQNLSPSQNREPEVLSTKLSDREFEILRLIGQGKEAQEIAAELHLSVKTIDTHRAHIKEKLGLKHGAELIRYAVHWLDSEGGPG